MKTFTANWPQFKTDCKILADEILKNPIKDLPKPKSILSLNKEGARVAEELKKLIPTIKKEYHFEANSEKITLPLISPQKIKGPAILVAGVQDTGKTLRKALEYLDITFEKQDLDITIAILYDKLRRGLVTYILPTYCGVGFTNGDTMWITFPWETLNLINEEQNEQ